MQRSFWHITSLGIIFNFDFIFLPISILFITLRGCYFNSLIQNLYMMNYLRENIISDEDNKHNKNKIFYQFKVLLTEMKFSFSDYIIPKNLFNALENWDKKKLNPKEQMDLFFL